LTYFYLQYNAQPTNFKVDEQQILRYFSNGSYTIVVPPHCIEMAIANMHSHALSGHFGTNKTIHKTKRTYYWQTMSRQVKQFIASCITCQKLKQPTSRPRAHLQLITTSRPFETINIDVAGPLATTKYGKRFILVAVDQFSKFVIAQATSNFTAETTAKFIYEKIVCQLGTPHKIITDQGNNFESQLIQELCRALQIV
jgi:hypothetical protein